MVTMLKISPRLLGDKAVPWQLPPVFSSVSSHCPAGLILMPHGDQVNALMPCLGWGHVIQLCDSAC